MLKTDVLIVGGGPAGAHLARLLANAGIKNTLLQKSLSYKKPCGGGIRMDAFDEFGLDKKLISKEVHTLVLAHKSSRIEIDISKSPIAIVDRVAFDSALREDARSAGSEVLEATFVSFERRESNFLSTFKVGETTQTILSKELIAADGANSKIKKLLGIKSHNILTHYSDIEEYECTNCEFHFGDEVAPKHYAWIFPHACGSNIGSVSPSQSNLIALKRHLGVNEQSKIKGYPIPLYDNPTFYKDGVYFVGDSAAQVLPFTYEGIYYSLSSASILASVLTQNAKPSEYAFRWREHHGSHFKTLKLLQKIFLANDFMVGIMMRLYRDKTIQNEMLKLWLAKRSLHLNAAFFIKILRKIF